METIDRFGLMPEPVKNLFRVTELKLEATPIGVRKIERGPGGGRITFSREPDIEPMKIISLIQPRTKEYKLGAEQRLRIAKALPAAEERLKVLSPIGVRTIQF